MEVIMLFIIYQQEQLEVTEGHSPVPEDDLC